MAGAEEHVIHHRGHGAAFEDRFASKLGVAIGLSGVEPSFNLEMLVLERMGELVSHNHALIFEGNPVCDVKFVGFGVVETGDLLGEQLDHKRVEVKALRNETKSFGALFVRVPLGGGPVLIHLANHVSTDFLAGAQGLLDGALEREAGDLTHLLEDFVGSGQEFGVGLAVGGRGSSWRRRGLGQDSWGSGE